jgi:hypothetical protein
LFLFLQLLRQFGFCVCRDRFGNRISVPSKIVGTIPEPLSVKPLASLASTVVSCSVEWLISQLTQNPDL